MNFVLGIDAGNIRGGGTVTHLIEILRVINPVEHGFSRVILWGGTELLFAIENRPWLIKRNPIALNCGFVRRTLWQSFQLSKEAKKENCDVLFVPGGAYIGLFRPVVVLSQNLLPFDLAEMSRYGFSQNLLRLWLLRLSHGLALKKADGSIFLTRFACDAISRSIGLFRGKIRIIPHGLGERFRMVPKPHRSIDEYSFSKPFRLLYVSTIDEYKHQWHVIEAVAQLRSRFRYPLVLDLIGSAYPPSLARLKSKMRQLDPENEWVNYHGIVPYEELHKNYVQADLGIFASSCENMPIILLEMMGAGLSIACSSRGPMPEVLGDAGVYFDPESPDDISYAIRKLVVSSELRSTMAAKSFLSSKKFSWDKCAAETFSFLAAVLKSHRIK
jgi:glycosyltransferase involved in cell wall biosynthesis